MKCEPRWGDGLSCAWRDRHPTPPLRVDPRARCRRVGKGAKRRAHHPLQHTRVDGGLASLSPPYELPCSRNTAPHFPFSSVLPIRFASTAQYVAGRNRCSKSMNHASLPIRIRGWFFSMPVMMRCAAAGGVVLATASKRSIDCARRALSVIPAPVRELRTMLVSTPPEYTTDNFTELFAIASSCRRLSEKP